MQTVAVGVLIVDVAGKASWTGLVAAASFLPIRLLSPVGGAMADRLGLRTVTAGAAVVFLAVASPCRWRGPASPTCSPIPPPTTARLSCRLRRARPPGPR